MKNFELKTWMTENREVVISKYEELTKEKFFNGIELKAFMQKVYNIMVMNAPKSEKRATSLLNDVISNVYVANSNVEAFDARTENLKKLYNGTSGMALV